VLPKLRKELQVLLSVTSAHRAIASINLKLTVQYLLDTITLYLNKQQWENFLELVYKSKVYMNAEITAQAKQRMSVLLVSQMLILNMQLHLL